MLRDATLSVRPITPNMVLYDEDTDVDAEAGKSGMFSSPPPAVTYNSPPDSVAHHVPEVGGGNTGNIWTIHNEKNSDKDDDDGSSTSDKDDLEEDTKILLEKEFEDYFEDRVHKSAGPVIFVSKMMGMLPVIWTEEETAGDCKSYFNLYSFILFFCWLVFAIITGYRVDKVKTWPNLDTKGKNATDPIRFISESTMETYIVGYWVTSLTALVFGIFKCRTLAEIFFSLSETDAQLELREKHYSKLRRKTIGWTIFYFSIWVLHGFGVYTMMKDAGIFEILLFSADVLAHTTVVVLDVQFIHLSLGLCKRYRLVNKILVYITKPWKNTFKTEAPPNSILQNILQYRFDQIFEPPDSSVGGNDGEILKSDISKKKVPLEILLKTESGGGIAPFGNEQSSEPKISKEEENTFILQLDILRGIHADLNKISNEVNGMLGFQILVHLISSVLFIIMFGYFFSASLIDDRFYWPYLVLCAIPLFRVCIIGHWGQGLDSQSERPFLTICQVSTVDGSPRLERQVQKLTVQMRHQCPRFTAAGYFIIGRNMIFKIIGVATLFTFFLVQFDEIRKNNTK